MTTEAGKRLLERINERSEWAMSERSEWLVMEDIAAIEAEAHEAGRRSIEQDGTRDAWKAEAIAAERARIAEAVRGLPQTWSHEPPPGHHVHGGLNRAAVLAIIEGP